MRSAIYAGIILSFFVFLLASPSINALTPRDNEAKEEIFTELSKRPAGEYKTIIATTHDNKTLLIYNQSEAPPPPPVQCPTGTVYNETSKKCDALPPTPLCPPGQHFNTTTNKCQDDKVTPPPPPSGDKPNTTFNQSQTLRVAVIGDIDLNSGLTTELNLAKKYNSQVLLVLGDYGYKSCQGVIDAITAAGFTKANTFIIEGNHDCAAVTKAFNGLPELYGSHTFSNGKLEVFAIDANAAFDCASTQFKTMKDKIQSSDAHYNLVGIHQPFVTVKSQHGPNGQFNCWDPVFHANGVNGVLQAHNHNYQRFDVSGLLYGVFGTGTHDTGSSMYPCSSDNWNGVKGKCITGTNGITLMDLKIDDPNVKSIHGYFLSNSDSLKDSFTR